MPAGQKEAFDKALIVGIFVWALETTPPAHIFLICGDRDFSNGLHALRNKCYNITLVCPSGVKVSHTCAGAASSVWDWASLAQGSGLKPHDPDAPNPSLKSENATWRSTIPAWKTAPPTSPPPNPTALPAKSAESAWRNSPTAWKVVSQPTASPQPAVTEQQQPVGLPAVKLLKTNPLDGKLYLNSKGKKLIDSAMASLESDKLSPVRNAVTARMKEILEGLGESSSYHSLKQVAEVAVASEYLTPLEGSQEGEIVVLTSRLSGGCWEIIYPHDTTDAYGTDTWHALRTFLETPEKVKRVQTCKSR